MRPEDAIGACSSVALVVQASDNSRERLTESGSRAHIDVWFPSEDV